MKYLLITALILMAGFAVVYADFYPNTKVFTAANVRVVRFTDDDNGNNCYVVLSPTTGAMNSISCVAGSVTPIKK